MKTTSEGRGTTLTSDSVTEGGKRYRKRQTSKRREKTQVKEVRVSGRGSGSRFDSTVMMPTLLSQKENQLELFPNVHLAGDRSDAWLPWRTEYTTHRK